MDILEKVQAIMRKELGLTEAQVQADQQLIAIGVDSLTGFELMFALEKAFDLQLPDTPEMPETVAGVAELVRTALAEKSV